MDGVGRAHLQLHAQVDGVGDDPCHAEGSGRTANPVGTECSSMNLHSLRGYGSSLEFGQGLQFPSAVPSLELSWALIHGADPPAPPKSAKWTGMDVVGSDFKS